MTTNNHPAHGPVSLDRLHQISEILSKAAAQSDGGNLGYAMADAVKVIDEVLEARNSEPVGAPGAWLWVKSTGYITAGINRPMYEPQHSAAIPLYAVPPSPPAPVSPDKMTVEMAYPRVQTNWHDAKNFAEGWNACLAAMLQAGNHTEKHLDVVDHFVDANEKGKDGTLINEGTMPATQIKPVADLYGITSPTGSETTFTFDASEASSFAKSGWTVQEYVELERYQQSVTGNSPEVPDCWIPVSERMPEDEQEVIVHNKLGCRYVSYFDEHSGLFFDMKGGNQVNCIEHILVTHWMPSPSEPQKE